jgi:hypothetical protein
MWGSNVESPNIGPTKQGPTEANSVASPHPMTVQMKMKQRNYCRVTGPAAR